MFRNRPYNNGLLNIFLVLSLLIGSVAFPTGVQAATLTVINTNDSGAGSLRDTIAGAASGDTITFDSALSGSTILVASPLDLLEDVTIDGSSLASKITISGGGNTRVFYVGSGVTATLDRLIVSQGRVEGNGGGLLNDGALTITNSLFSASTANNGVGGNIMNNDTGTLTVIDSTFSGGSAWNGAAIGNYNQATITNSTFLDNTSGDVGGAIYNDSAVEGHSHNTLTITNSTFSGNSATYGGGIWSEQPMTVRNSTFSGNEGRGVGSTGAGIYQEGAQLDYANTLIANSVGTGTDCHAQSGVAPASTNNLVENDFNCASPLNVEPNLGPLADNDGTTQTFALLANSPAIDAGNDATCTSAPVSNLDQRGIARPNGGHCDIGAYEYVDTTAPSVTAFSVPASPTVLDIPITTFTVSEDAILTGYLITESPTPPTLVDPGWTASAPTTYPVASMGSFTLYPWAKDAADHVSAVYGPASVNITCLTPITVTSNADSGPGTLRQALADACVGDINNITMIDFASALSGGTIHLASTLTISKNMTIDGSDLDEPITISGDDNVRVFNIPTIPAVSLTVTLDSLIVTKGATNGHGAGLFMGQGMHVTIKKSIFSDNHAGERGGGIGNQGGLTLIDSTVSGNSAAGTDGGGGISNESGLTMTNSTIFDNHATGSGASGGGLFNTGGATITNSTIFGNSTTTYGGGISTTANLTITNSTIAGNSAGIVGGLLVEGNVTHLRNTIIANNSSTTINSFSYNDCSDTTDYLNPPTPDGDGIMTNVNNLIENSNCSPFLSGDPKLGALADNGGLTQTLALLPGSPAINGGDNTTCPATDQRGIARPQGSHCDIGAYEVEVANIQVNIAGNIQGPYSLLPQETQRKSYVGVNQGPVKAASTYKNLPIIAAERVIYKAAGGVPTSFSEMLGLPDSQLDTTYWLPWYNNVDLDTQLRFANVSGLPATVQVSIGGNPMDSFNLAVDESIRKSYTGVNNGPVKIESDQNIVAAERVIYKVNGVNTSFSEMMALPNSQLDTTYWLPWYNNVDLDSQLRIANTTASTATVHVSIDGVPMTGSPFTLDSGESTRVSFAGINEGPVEIDSDQNIVASERVIYRVQGVQTSFSEMMALPESQVDTTYSLPWYNNIDLDTQLRIGNVSGSTATVHVFVGGTEVTPVSGITLLTGESTRVSYAGINNGPVQIVSDVSIVAAERVIYKVNGVNTSFSEMMALPNDLLDATFWFPWYNNKDLDTQLRFGLP